MKITIVTDGNNTLGMGHVYQTMTLVSFLNKADANVEISFLTKSGDNVISLLKTTGYEVYFHSDDDSIFNALKTENPDRILFDKLDVSPELAKKIKEEISAKLIIMTNITDANEYADMTVLADIGSNFENIRKENNDTGKVEFWGPKYWLLRPEFYDYKKNKKIHPAEVKNIMLIFGGADPCNYSTLVLNELLSMKSNFNIKLIIGSAFNNRKELDAVINNHLQSSNTVEVLENIKNVSEIMYNSHVVFASPGLSFFESLAIGTPVIGFHQNELQGNVYNEGALPTIDKSKLSELKSMIENKSFLYPEDPFIAKMEIGEGKDEIINEILN
jgi:spore coat polysaccharide biosynthesis predicted glycosyltransferase SpsG